MNATLFVNKNNFLGVFSHAATGSVALSRILGLVYFQSSFPHSFSGCLGLGHTAEFYLQAPSLYDKSVFIIYNKRM